MQLIRFILIVVIFNTFYDITSAQAELCDGCYVWEFVNDKGERDETTRLLSNDVEDILSQYKDCKVLQRARYAKLQEQINNEKAIQSLNSATAQVKSELKTIQAKRVIFGTASRDFQGNIILRLSFENLSTSQIKSSSAFILGEEYYNFDKRKQKLVAFINSFINPDGKLINQITTPNNPDFSQQTIENSQWKFTLEDCKRSGSNIALVLKVTSKGQERIIRIVGFGRLPGTKIYDDDGREFSPIKLEIGNNVQSGHSIDQQLISDLPTKVIITFSEIPNDMKKLSLFQLDVYEEEYPFKFRNIQIRNQ